MNDSATLTSLTLVGRTLQFSCGMLLVNVAFFRWLVLPSAPPGAGGMAIGRFVRRLDTILVASALGLVFSGGALFLAAAAGMSGTPLVGIFDATLLATVLRETDFGRVCQMRAILALALGAMIACRRWSYRRECVQPQRRTGSVVNLALHFLTALLAAALFLSVALESHAAAVPRTGLPWPLLADLGHLASVAIWPGGLLPFALFLGVLKGNDAPDLDFIVKTVRRFSTISFVAVIALALTGIANAWFLVGNLAHLVGSTYGRILCLKLFVFLLMLGVAGWNRQVLLPRLFRSATEADAGEVTRAARTLRRFVFSETALALVVVILVSILGITPPPAGP